MRQLKNDWTWCDDVLRALRIKKVRPFIKKGNILCDLGCGHEAHLLKTFSPVIKKGYGFDMKVIEGMYYNYEIKTLHLDDVIPLPDASVDIVTMLAALEHFHDEENILKEAHRILKPGGMLLITVPTQMNKPLLEMLAKLHIISKAEIIDHKRYYTKRRLLAVLNAAGFLAKQAKVHYWELGFNLFARAEKNV